MPGLFFGSPTRRSVGCHESTVNVLLFPPNPEVVEDVDYHVNKQSDPVTAAIDTALNTSPFEAETVVSDSEGFVAPPTVEE